jgi:predicted TPR repeat methyltransferase
MSDKETIEVYNQNVEKYRALVDKLPNTKTLKSFMGRFDAGANILDFGCGVGDSAAAMRAVGLRPVCRDGSVEMVKTANELYQLNASVALFSELNDNSVYDGVWANFSLLHASKSEFPYLISALHTSLKPKGWLFVALKLGNGESRDKFGRHYAYYQEDELDAILIKAGFAVDEKIYGKSKGMAGTDEPWIGGFYQKAS